MVVGRRLPLTFLLGHGNFSGVLLNFKDPRDPNHLLRMVMESKYYAFRRWLDTPCSSAENMSGFLAGGVLVKIIEKSHRDMSARLPSPRRTCRHSVCVCWHKTRWWAQWNHGWKKQKTTQDVVINLGGGFKHVLFSSLFGEMIQFD